jgi:threonine dehydrogenase-like Zn-dependent dehydrogenase
MKALVYQGPGQRHWEDVPDPHVEDAEDAIVRVDAVTICGTDLHILKGDVPTAEAPRVLGHEAVGTVLEVGSGVRRVKAGDRVLSRASARAGGVGSAVRGGTGNAWAVAAGSSVTASMACRQRRFGSRSRTRRPTPCRTASRTRPR